MKILMTAAEAVPFVKSGGLADVIGSLPKAIQATSSESEVRVIVPKYEDLPQRWREQLSPVASYTVQMGWRQLYCGVEQLTHNGIIYYFIDNEFYFKRSGLYGYEDDGERFAYFCQSVLEALPRLGWKPDIVHAHDWHTGLVPVFLRTHYASNAWYQGIKTVFTIHNLKYQGIFGREVMEDLLNLGDEHFHVNGLEFFGNVNYMKGALMYCDYITTVSPTYAKEIQLPYYGEGLDGVLRYRRGRLQGIINGLDDEMYAPSHDPYIAVPYEGASVQAKRRNKTTLQRELGFPESEETPMIAVVTRLVEQKGIDLIVHVLPELMQEELQLVVLGSGDADYESRFRDGARHYPNRLSANIKFDDGLARRIYAGADLFLMPSKFEPCGIGQMIAMRYGAVPIVRETGGLADTVYPYNEFEDSGHGFSFTHYNAHEMLDAVRRALALYKNQARWERLSERVAKLDLSWKASAKKYVLLYQSLARA